MSDELIYGEDRLTGGMLTPEEIEALRTRVKKDAAFARQYFREHPPGKAKVKDETR